MLLASERTPKRVFSPILEKRCFGSLFGFRSNAGPSGSCLDFQFQHMFGPLQARPSCLCEQASWPQPPLCYSWHINCLEHRAVFLALIYFLSFLRRCHVIVRTDNMAVVSHINRHGGSRSHTLNRLARRLLLWSQDKFLSLRAVHVPAVLNLAANFLSRPKLRLGEWLLNHQTVAQIWDLFGEAEVYFFASQESSQCPLWFSLSSLSYWSSFLGLISSSWGSNGSPVWALRVSSRTDSDSQGYSFVGTNVIANCHIETQNFFWISLAYEMRDLSSPLSVGGN